MLFTNIALANYVQAPKFFFFGFRLTERQYIARWIGEQSFVNVDDNRRFESRRGRTVRLTDKRNAIPRNARNDGNARRGGPVGDVNHVAARSSKRSTRRKARLTYQQLAVHCRASRAPSS